MVELYQRFFIVTMQMAFLEVNSIENEKIVSDVHIQTSVLVCHLLYIDIFECW